MPALDALTTAYRTVHRLSATAPLPTDAAAQIKMMADGIEAAKAGQVGFGWSLTTAMQWVFESAPGTTELAVFSYGFLADLTLGTAGLDYLVSGSGGNPNHLNSAYYQGMSLENRYINFAVNLVKHGEARQTFLAKYGDTSVFETARRAWIELFGVEKPLVDIVELLSDMVPDGRGGTYTRGEYFVQLGGNDGGNGIGTRAAVVGWLMAEAAKAGAGPYVAAVDSYIADLAFDGRIAGPSNVFYSLYGPRGDHARGGVGDQGLPGGATIDFRPDWDIDVNKPSPESTVRALATDGNDSIAPAVSNEGGLQAGHFIHAGGGNDVVMVSNGPMRGHVDGGAGNDYLIVDQFEGRVTTGSGHDIVDIGSFGQIPLTGNVVGTPATVADFTEGQDLMIFASYLGTGRKMVINFFAPVTFSEALQAYASSAAAGENIVFEHDGDTYIFHQNAVAGLDAGDGLIKLAGVVGLTVDNGLSGKGDILFGY